MGQKPVIYWQLPCQCITVASTIHIPQCNIAVCMIVNRIHQSSYHQYLLRRGSQSECWHCLMVLQQVCTYILLYVCMCVVYCCVCLCVCVCVCVCCMLYVCICVCAVCCMLYVCVSYALCVYMCVKDQGPVYKNYFISYKVVS